MSFNPIDAIRFLWIDSRRPFMSARERAFMRRCVSDWVSNPTIVPATDNWEFRPAEPAPVPTEEEQWLIDYYQWRAQQSFLIIGGERFIVNA